MALEWWFVFCYCPLWNTQYDESMGYIQWIWWTGCIQWWNVAVQLHPFIFLAICEGTKATHIYVSPVSQILFPSSTPPNHRTTATSCITSSLAWHHHHCPVLKHSFMFLLLSNASKRMVVTKWKVLLPHYQITSIHITRPTYKHILNQAIKKISGTFTLMNWQHIVKYQLHWQTEKSQVSCLLNLTWAQIDD